MADVSTKQPLILRDASYLNAEYWHNSRQSYECWRFNPQRLWFVRPAAQRLPLKSRFCSMQTSELVGEKSCLRLSSPQPQTPQRAGNSRDANSPDRRCFDQGGFVPFSNSQWNFCPCCRNPLSTTSGRHRAAAALIIATGEKQVEEMLLVLKYFSKPWELWFLFFLGCLDCFSPARQQIDPIFWFHRYL